MTLLSNETVRKLQAMHLGVMAEAFSTQLQDSQFQTVSFEDRFAMLGDAEWSARKSNRLTRLIRNAGYADPSACVENIEYLPERKLDREQILRLASCTYLQEAHNVIILGATGAGKICLALSLIHISLAKALLQWANPKASSMHSALHTSSSTSACCQVG